MSDSEPPQRGRIQPRATASGRRRKSRFKLHRPPGPFPDFKSDRPGKWGWQWTPRFRLRVRRVRVGRHRVTPGRSLRVIWGLGDPRTSTDHETDRGGCSAASAGSPPVSFETRSWNKGAGLGEGGGRGTPTYDLFFLSRTSNVRAQCEYPRRIRGRSNVGACQIEARLDDTPRRRTS